MRGVCVSVNKCKCSTMWLKSLDSVYLIYTVNYTHTRRALKISSLFHSERHRTVFSVWQAHMVATGCYGATFETTKIITIFDSSLFFLFLFICCLTRFLCIFSIFLQHSIFLFYFVSANERRCCERQRWWRPNTKNKQKRNRNNISKYIHTHIDSILTAYSTPR